MIMLLSAFLSLAATSPEADAARTAWTRCTDGLWPQAEAGTRPATAADSILDYCKPQHDAWVAAAVHDIDAGAGTAEQKAAARTAVQNQDNGARAQLIRQITQARRHNH